MWDPKAVGEVAKARCHRLICRVSVNLTQLKPQEVGPAHLPPFRCVSALDMLAYGSVSRPFSQETQLMPTDFVNTRRYQGFATEPQRAAKTSDPGPLTHQEGKRRLREGSTWLRVIEGVEPQPGCACHSPSFQDDLQAFRPC